MKEQHIVTTYDEDLDKLKSDLFEMALNVEKQIFDSVNLTQILDIKKANQIIKNDDKIDKTTLKKFLNIMNEESKRMNTLIDDILSLSKVESEEHILPSTTISIFEPINSVMSTIKKSGLLKNNNLILIDDRVDKNQSLLVEADFLELTQVFYNLIENGIKYGNSNSDILIKGSRSLQLEKSQEIIKQISV